MIGLAPLDRLDATPKPTKTFFNRPSQSSAMSCDGREAEAKTSHWIIIKEPTLDVEARAFTTPVTSYGDVCASDIVSVSSAVPSETGFDRGRRSHHSAPIVHSLS